MAAEPNLRRPRPLPPRTRSEGSILRPRDQPGRLVGGIAGSTDEARQRGLVSIVIPTFNEASNIELVMDRIDGVLERGLPDRPYEIIVVDDDSADGTWRVAEARSRVDPRVKVVRRVGQRGLSSAVLAGMAMARGDVMVVIDADLQHDEERIPDLVRAVWAGADVALGSREVDGGGYGSFGTRRLAASRLGAALARRVAGVEVSDPMSGFFAVSADRHRQLSDDLNPRGFKILLEFLARGPRPQVAEVGYVFGQRAGGSTKFSGSVGLAFLVSLLDLARANRRRRRRPPPPSRPTDGSTDPQP